MDHLSRQTQAWLCVILCCAGFVLAGWMLIPYNGIQEDEALVALPIYGPVVRDFRIRVFHRDIPLMVMDYNGALKSWLYWPIFHLFQPSPASLRIPVLLIGALTIALFYRLLHRIGGMHAALAGCCSAGHRHDISPDHRIRLGAGGDPTSHAGDCSPLPVRIRQIQFRKILSRWILRARPRIVGQGALRLGHRRARNRSRHGLPQRTMGKSFGKKPGGGARGIFVGSLAAPGLQRASPLADRSEPSAIFGRRPGRKSRRAAGQHQWFRTLRLHVEGAQTEKRSRSGIYCCLRCSSRSQRRRSCVPPAGRSSSPWYSWRQRGCKWRSPETPAAPCITRFCCGRFLSSLSPSPVPVWDEPHAWP